ncbi:MAG: DUF2357 domain-containing protein [Rhodospirillaceae bacterium]|nr:DUF2357 domain-containing protein [Rhodospirillaceae bacterium]
MPSDLYLLPLPWAGITYDLHPIRAGETVDLVPASASPLLLVSGQSDRVLLDGRDGRLAREADFPSRDPRLGRVTQRYLSLPWPVRADHPQTLRPGDWPQSVSLRWGTGVDRPSLRSAPSGQGTGSPAAEADHNATGQTAQPSGGPAGFAYQDFVRRLIGRMADIDTVVQDPDHAADPWAEVYRRWSDFDRLQDPHMSVLVRHAQTLQGLLEDVCARPRRLLRRVRELQSVDRVQDIDAQCMVWLSRQPGETIAERAGPRQRILGLAREATADTLENRVLRDLLWRSDRAARDYARLHSAVRHSQRVRLVDRHGHHCRLLEREMAAMGVSRLATPFQPNFVLQHDVRYRRIHAAWLDLVRERQVEDDSWQWQHRSWAEFCTAALAAAARTLAGHPPIAASPVVHRAEQSQGQWLIHDNPLLVAMADHGGWILEVLGQRAHVGVVDRGSMDAFGATSWLKVDTFGGEPARYVPVWAIHPRPGAPGLDCLVAKAANAVKSQQQSGWPLVGGLVLTSTVDPQDPGGSAARSGVFGVSFGPEQIQLALGLEELGNSLRRLVEAAT